MKSIPAFVVIMAGSPRQSGRNKERAGSSLTRSARSFPKVENLPPIVARMSYPAHIIGLNRASGAKGIASIAVITPDTAGVNRKGPLAQVVHRGESADQGRAAAVAFVTVNEGLFSGHIIGACNVREAPRPATRLRQRPLSHEYRLKAPVGSQTNSDIPVGPWRPQRCSKSRDGRSRIVARLAKSAFIAPWPPVDLVMMAHPNGARASVEVS